MHIIFESVLMLFTNKSSASAEVADRTLFTSALRSYFVYIGVA